MRNREAIQFFYQYLLVIIFVFTASGTSQNLSFKNLTTENGLSNNKINDIIQDKAGFIWLATDDGLNRFDGYNFKVYRHIPEDSTSISSNNIWRMFEDEEGIIWIGTKSGELIRYDPKTDKFSSWEINSPVVKENSITTIYKDRNEFVWIGTYRSGLYRFNPKSGEIQNWRSDPYDLKSLSNNYITSIAEDEEGNLLITTYVGLNIFNYKQSASHFRHIYHDSANRANIKNIFWSLTRSNIFKDVYWIGTADGLVKYNSATEDLSSIPIPNTDNLQFGTGSGNVIEELINNQLILWAASYAGLLRINSITGETVRYIANKNKADNLISNQINRIIKDRSGVTWIATENGLSHFSSKGLKFNSVYSERYQFEILRNSNITAFERTQDATVWIGTNNGLFHSFKAGNKIFFKKYSQTEGLNIWSLAANNNELYIGTYGSGLFIFNTTTGLIKQINLEDIRLSTQSVNFIKSLSFNNGILSIGFWGLGMAELNTITGGLKVFQNFADGNPNSISHNDVWVLFRDSMSRLWVGTNGGGLNLLEISQSEIFRNWTADESNFNALNSNNVYSIIESSKSKYRSKDEKFILWIGTSNGLNKFIVTDSNEIDDYKSVVIKNFNVSDGLSNNSINSILEDENGNLWLGTGSGISFFDVEKETFSNFSIADGIIGGSINTASAIKLENGLMLFGSTDGLNYFHPEDIKLSDFVPPIVFTDFQIFNQSVPDRKLFTNPAVSGNAVIKLSYNENVFSFEFAALDFNSPQSIQYAYMMEGFDKEWITSGSRRYITYTNLSPGEYKFKVKSTNADGVWVDNEAGLSVIIGSPWWATGWAYIAYILVIISGLYALRRFELNRSRLKNIIKMREFETNKQKELDEMKSHFFANLSHEFRTPLMLIKGPMEQLMEDKSNGKHLQRYRMIYRNTQNLQSLIDQLLELSQLEAATIPVKAKYEDVLIVLKGIVYSFTSFAEGKNITLSFNSSENSVKAWIDKDKLEKIINNLLSNAFKFTNDGGVIEVKVEKLMLDSRNFIQLRIKDSGIGIPKAKLEKIFDRFYQVDDSSQRAYGGSGIGLALVKELVELHRWEISVVSEVGQCTEFTIKIPLWDYLDENQKVRSESIDTSELIRTESLNPVESPQTDYPGANQNKDTDSILINDLPSILLVEDSLDVRSYLYDLLKSEYIIYQAGNGKEGITLAQEKMPDLIISDVMMPEMDGMEFCRRIKTDWMTSHIPVILLTAKASGESKIEGLETGADDYLTKPFSSRELFIRIKNLLEQRKKLREKFGKAEELKPVAPIPNPIDEEFIQRAFDLVEKSLDNTQFDVDTFAKEMFLSRMQLHRKLQSITGQTPGDFIRTFRMKKAAQLLKENKLSITQIAYEVGYNSPAQFSRAFSKQFNSTPSEYLNR
jgi:signal transduction histidine kinase/ligand-binding sensor domain-containing protein/DNA-binding response OmpR family regulator